MYKKILLLCLLFLAVAGFASATKKYATLLNTVTGEKRVVEVGSRFMKDEVLFGSGLGARVPVFSYVYTGGVYSTSSLQSTATMVGTEMAGNNVISFSPNKQGGCTLTLAASSSLPFSSNPGSPQAIYIYNATSTANTPLYLSPGTGNSFFTASSTGGALS